MAFFGIFWPYLTLLRPDIIIQTYNFNFLAIFILINTLFDFLRNALPTSVRRQKIHFRTIAGSWLTTLQYLFLFVNSVIRKLFPFDFWTVWICLFVFLPLVIVPFFSFHWFSQKVCSVSIIRKDFFTFLDRSNCFH